MLHVECYPGRGGQDTPRMLVIGDRKIFVEEVLDTWSGPGHVYFKLQGDDGDVYIIQQDTASKAWELKRSRQG
jgi:hypothetical protein